MIAISKLEAAKRQLETAISLFFNQGDIVSIHTLIHASHTLLYEMGKSEDHKSIIKDMFVERVRPEKRDEFRKRLNKSASYFKHGQNNAKALKFGPFESELYLFDAVRLYQSITGEVIAKMQMYSYWYIRMYPDHFEVEMSDRLTSAMPGFDPKNRRQFFNHIPELERALLGDSK